MDVDGLDDSVLYSSLLEHNIAAGPIVDSTRNFYRRKLKIVLEEEANAGNEYQNEGDGGSVGRESDSQNENSQSDQPSDWQYENSPSPSDTEDDQPSGISRPVTQSELRSRFHGGESLANRRTFIEKREEVEKGSYTGWFFKALIVMIIIGTISYFLLS